MKKRYLRLAALTAGVLLAAQTGLSAAALSTFDAAYYAAQYPDVAAVCGNDECALLRHYLDLGIDEGRINQVKIGPGIILADGVLQPLVFLLYIHGCSPHFPLIYPCRAAQ